MTALILTALLLAALLATAARAASMATLHRREHRQLRTLWRDRGTERFFAHRPWLAHTRPGRKAVRFARAELIWVRRELAETRAERAMRISQKHLRNSARALRNRSQSQMRTALASWYGPGLYGNTLACGGTLTTTLVGVANRWLGCGTRLIVCYRSRCSSATVVDRGPYVAGRDFDLTGALAARLGFGGVDTIRWAVTG